MGFIEKYRKMSRERRMEAELPDILYQAANMISYSNPEEVIRWISGQNYDLSPEFSVAYREIKNGESVERALGRMHNRASSPLIRRAIRLLSMEQRTGRNIGKSFRDIADDTQETLHSRREKAAASSIEKYTLVLAGSLIVPMMLGVMISLSENMGDDYGLGIGMPADERAEILANSILGTQIYTMAYAAMASFFIALQEERMERAIAYAMLMLPMSMLALNIAKSVDIIAAIS